MRIILSMSLVFLLALSSGSVFAQSGGGNTLINATVSGVWILNLSLQHADIIVPENYSFYENLAVFQVNTKSISVYLNKTDANGFLKFADGAYQDNHTIHDLAPNVYENVSLRVYIQPGMGFDNATYNLSVNAYSQNDSRSNVTTLKIRVNNTSPVDGVEILNIYPSSLYQGQSLTANISVHKIYPGEATDVQVCYCTNPNPTYQCGPSYNNYGCEWKTMNEWLNYTKTITVNEGPGEYYFFAAVKYPGDADIIRALSPKFLVRQVPGPPGGGPPVGPPPSPQPRLGISAPDYLEAAPGETVRFGAGVGNTGTANASGTSLRVYGVPENWVFVTPPEQDIGTGESRNYSVTIFIPWTAKEQIYSLSLVAKSGAVESARTVTLTVAMTPEKRAGFLLEEAISRKGEAEGMIEKAKKWSMRTQEPEGIMASANSALDEAGRLFDSGDYPGSIEKSKQAIDGYGSVVASVNGIIEEAYFIVLNRIRNEIKGMENLTEERDVLDSVKEKIDQSIVLWNEGRMTDAYSRLLEADQLLSQLRGKTFFRELTQNIIIISILVVIAVAVVVVIFYKKRMSRFLKTIRIEEHKKSLKKLFEREVRPGISYEEKPKVDRESLKEMRRLIDIGEAYIDTDFEGARDAYTKARKIYSALSSEEKKLVSDDIIRLMRLYNRIARKSS